MTTAPTEVRTSPKKARKPQTRSLQFHDAIMAVAAEFKTLTVRQLFYQLESRGVVPKTENGYKRVCDAAVQLRRAGRLPYAQIVDGHRERRLVFAAGSLREGIENLSTAYRRDYWRAQPRQVEIWCEKDALSGVIAPICEHYGVPYAATRGFSSLSLYYHSALYVRSRETPARIYYFGDHDPSGQDMHTRIEGELRGHGADATVIRIALEPRQILDLHLPTRPSKKGDSRYAGFVERYGDASVELDAMPPNILQDLVEACILENINVPAWNAVLQAERLDRETLASLAALDLKPGYTYQLTKQGE